MYHEACGAEARQVVFEITVVKICSECLGPWDPNAAAGAAESREAVGCANAERKGRRVPDRKLQTNPAPQGCPSEWRRLREEPI